MFTICPNCNRQYRIRAEQISAASGEVRCGFCAEQFNAIGRLSDFPVADVHHREESSPQSSIIDEPDPDNINEPEFDISDIEQETRQASNEEPEFNLSEVSVIEDQDDDLPEILKENIPEENISTTSRIIWLTGVFVMILISITQIAWFNRDKILQQYPQWVTRVEDFCSKYNCKLLRERNITSIKILNRDVRTHPVYQDTLLVNATMSNQSSNNQPYPRIQLTLFNTAGKIVAYREFNPEEYLDKSIVINEGMKPDQPVHFVLEVTGHADDAVGFEFRFL